MLVNGHIIYGKIRYNVFCDDPCYSICGNGVRYLHCVGWNADTQPWVEDEWEEFLLYRGYLKCISIPSNESKYDQLNYEMQYLYLMNG